MGISLIAVPLALAVIGTVAVRQEAGQQEEVVVFNTRIKDEELLKKTLENYECQVVHSMGVTHVEIQETPVSLRRNEQGVYQAYFFDSVTTEKAESVLEELHEQYTLSLQEQVYQKLKEKASERGFYLESEEIEADNSIVLTYAIGK